MDSVSPPRSFPSSPSFEVARSARSSPISRPALSLDLSNLPALSQPSPPSNTLLITDLHDLYLFQPASLEAIRARITAVAPLNSFSPLPSFRRIVCSFLSVDDAVRIRQLLDGEALLNRAVRPRIYFGESTPLLDQAGGPKFLEAPQLDKLFFISPPPSPPHGWVMRNEEPPNKEVHAHDLAYALSQLKTHHDDLEEQQPQPQPQQSTGPASGSSHADPATPVSISSDKRTPSWPVPPRQRSRSSTLIYHPDNHGGSPNLPAVMVEDTSLAVDELDSDVDMLASPVEQVSLRKLPPKTSRPPVELM
ncbi:hypothetical protein ASPZODRAFT_65072 [Penicilliopsis zonata CBS 506.65]|uniref:Calcipressin n=1 Tax=Penicilliopsis zonata CBS 506.65 TaxID=1073090 RepID=A0A1L9SIX0_9EURO|nr:hypothetical protein ASPZODRAFT_65072 [Penicilliopsis zonata CBS 506.65]OJJ47182.1 hypothetical protein ASPZODRAFT_65072 [Penicilliopsis zonata CBS 506.65]